MEILISDVVMALMLLALTALSAHAAVPRDGGVTDVYISNEVIAPAKLARVAALAQKLACRAA